MQFQNFLKNSQFIDSHIHLNSEVYEDNLLETIISRAKENRVEALIDMSVNISSLKKSLLISQKYQGFVFTAAGIDPEVFVPSSELKNESLDIDLEVSELESIIKNNLDKVIMIGEIGIDNYWIHKSDLSDDQIHDSITKQEKLFNLQLQIAKKYNLPVSIHSRNSVDKCIKMAQNFSTQGVFHSLTSDISDNSIIEQEKKLYLQISEIIEMKMYVGLNAIITFKSANILRDTFIRIMKEKVAHKLSNNSNKEFLSKCYEVGFIFETDGPYLIPSGFKPLYKNINEPTAIITIIEKLKDLF